MLFTFLLSTFSVTVADSWGYPYNESEWGSVSATCVEGKMQSPVDIAAHSGIAQSKLNITCDMPTDLVEEYALTWSVGSSTPPTLLFEEMTYALSKVECHFGSEHTVDGFRYPGSCQFVHQKGDKYAIVVVFMDDNAPTTNAAFDNALQNIDLLWGTMISGLDLHYYWEYTGSFTTPNCKENVQWIILRDVFQVTPAQIEQMKNDMGVNNNFTNFRDQMPLNSRAVRDGSEIGNLSVWWFVLTGFVSEETAREVLPLSVADVIGLSREMVLIQKFDVHGAPGTEPTPLDFFDVYWRLNVIDNTRSFVDRLLAGINATGHRTELASAIINHFETDTNITLKYFYSVRVGVISTTFWDMDDDGDKNDTIIIIVVVVVVVLLLFIVTIMFYLRRRRLQKQVAIEIMVDGRNTQTAGNETAGNSQFV